MHPLLKHIKHGPISDKYSVVDTQFDRVVIERVEVQKRVMLPKSLLSEYLIAHDQGLIDLDDAPRSNREVFTKGEGSSEWDNYTHGQESIILKLLNYLFKGSSGSSGLEALSAPLPLKYPQLMVMGPPGTGKSHLLSDRLTALGIDDDSGNVERVVGHPEMTSTDLIGMYRPVSDPGGALRYEFTAGPLIRLLARALQSDEPHVLVIEELNRTNAAATFAEFFQLLDRDEDGKSKYPTQLGVDVNRALGLGEEEKVRFPPNFAIWATVNTADQGVFPMDTAFKRRWTFEYLGVDQDEGVWGDPEQGWNPIIPGYQTLRWQDLRRALNRALENQGVEEDRQLGPFFVSQRELLISEDPPAFLDRLLSKVVAYLRDDVLRHDPALLFVENKGGYVSGFARLRSRARSEGLLSIFNDQLRGELDLSEGELTYHSIYLEWDQYRTLGAPSPELSAEGGVEDQDGAEQSPDLDLAEDQS